MYLYAPGGKAVFVKKYDITKHPRYRYLSDADKRDAFDVEKFLKRYKKPSSCFIVPQIVCRYQDIRTFCRRSVMFISPGYQ